MIVAAATEMSVLITVRETITPSLALDILRLAPELKAIIPKKNMKPTVLYVIHIELILLRALSVHVTM